MMHLNGPTKARWRRGDVVVDPNIFIPDGISPRPRTVDSLGLLAAGPGVIVEWFSDGGRAGHSRGWATTLDGLARNGEGMLVQLKNEEGRWSTYTYVDDSQDVVFVMATSAYAWRCTRTEIDALRPSAGAFYAYLEVETVSNPLIAAETFLHVAEETRPLIQERWRAHALIGATLLTRAGL